MTITFHTIFLEHVCKSCGKQILNYIPSVAGRIIAEGEYANDMYENIHNDEDRVVYGIYYCMDCVRSMAGYRIEVEETPIPYPGDSMQWVEKWRREKLSE